LILLNILSEHSMKLNGPYLTLAGGLAVGGVLLSLSVTAARPDGDPTPERVAAASQSKPATATPAAAAPATAKPALSQAADEPAPSEAAEPVPPGTYAGAVKGGDASVAVAIKDGTAIAYVCDGKKAEAWLQGPADKDSLSLTGKAGEALNAKYTDGRLSGAVKTSGKNWTFKVKTAKAPSGLYRAARNVREADVVGGWVVYDGKQVGVLNRAGVAAPAPPIDLASQTVTIDGTTVEVGAVDGSPLGSGD
jgi:hypothetical protein